MRPLSCMSLPDMIWKSRRIQCRALHLNLLNLVILVLLVMLHEVVLFRGTMEVSVLKPGMQG